MFVLISNLLLWVSLFIKPSSCFLPLLIYNVCSTFYLLVVLCLPLLTSCFHTHTNSSSCFPYIIYLKSFSFCQRWSVYSKDFDFTEKHSHWVMFIDKAAHKWLLLASFFLFSFFFYKYGYCLLCVIKIWKWPVYTLLGLFCFLNINWVVMLSVLFWWLHFIPWFFVSLSQSLVTE